MDKWEYLRANRALSQEELDKIGLEGWELVGFSATYRDYEIYIFKHKIQQDNGKSIQMQG